MAGAAGNMTISTAGGEEQVASHYAGGAQNQRIKPVYGASGETSLTDVQEANASTKGPLPVGAYHASDFIMVAGLGLTPKFKAIALAASGDVVDAVATKQIRVLALCAFVETAGTSKFQSGASSDLTGAMEVADTTPILLPFNPVGWFETVVGEKLNVVLATTDGLNGSLVYVEV